jgi:hypothetical protein
MNESEQDREDRDMAMLFADQQAFEEQARDALRAARFRALNADEIAALAWAARIPFPKEIRT